MTKTWKVALAESGQKLLPFLKLKLGQGFSLRKLKRAVDMGHCLINGRVERFASTLVGLGDTVSFYDEQGCLVVSSGNCVSPLSNFSEETNPPNCCQERILYIDDDLIAYNKPAGIIAESPHVIEYLIATYGAGVVLLHRLDRETTGVLLFARHEKAKEAMLKQFKQRQITKTYLAITDGVPATPSGMIENYLGKVSEYQGQTLMGQVTKERGSLARTKWILDRSSPGVALIRCYPETGRTHQIRIHLAGLGIAILGDIQYGRRQRCQYRPGRLMLHALTIGFRHPFEAKEVVINAPVPPDFQQAVDALLPPCEYQ